MEHKIREENESNKVKVARVMNVISTMSKELRKVESANMVVQIYCIVLLLIWNTPDLVEGAPIRDYAFRVLLNIYIDRQE